MVAGDDRLAEAIALARTTRSRAYAPYSHFRMGAAVVTEKGTVSATWRRGYHTKLQGQGRDSATGSRCSSSRDPQAGVLLRRLDESLHDGAIRRQADLHVDEARRDRRRRKGQHVVAGIYAAGDVTTAPYKQIVIAMGEFAKVALGAFEGRMRSVSQRTPAVMTSATASAA